MGGCFEEGLLLFQTAPSFFPVILDTFFIDGTSLLGKKTKCSRTILYENSAIFSEILKNKKEFFLHCRIESIE